jgi:hypothetical protein
MLGQIKMADIQELVKGGMIGIRGHVDVRLFHLGRCSWAGPRKTARGSAVTMIGSVLQGPIQLAVAQVGLQQSTLCDNQPVRSW